MAVDSARTTPYRTASYQYRLKNERPKRLEMEIFLHTVNSCCNGHQRGTKTGVGNSGGCLPVHNNGGVGNSEVSSRQRLTVAGELLIYRFSEVLANKENQQNWDLCMKV